MSNVYEELFKGHMVPDCFCGLFVCLLVTMEPGVVFQALQFRGNILQVCSVLFIWF